MVQLRHVYFLNPHRTKYVCLDFYPDRNNRAFFVLGGERQAPQVLPVSLVPKLELHIPKLYDHLDKGEMMFCMQTIEEIFSRIALNRTSVNLKLPEVEYLLLNLTALEYQLARYCLAETDVTDYVQSATGATTYVPPKDFECLFVQYELLFDKINGNLCLSECVCHHSAGTKYNSIRVPKRDKCVFVTLSF
jgi:hypothetical protein